MVVTSINTDAIADANIAAFLNGSGEYHTVAEIVAHEIGHQVEILEGIEAGARGPFLDVHTNNPEKALEGGREQRQREGRDPAQHDPFVHGH